MDTEDWTNVSEDALKNIIMQLTNKHQESMNRTVEYQANIGISPYYLNHIITISHCRHIPTINAQIYHSFQSNIFPLH